VSNVISFLFLVITLSFSPFFAVIGSHYDTISNVEQKNNKKKYLDGISVSLHST